VLIEIFDEPAERSADAVLAQLDALGATAPRVLHGEGVACWPLVAHTGRLGLPTRIGLENSLIGPRGTPAESNADLVHQALTVWHHAQARRP
jgi:uncharacterized protein (DUF849 family)